MKKQGTDFLTIKRNWCKKCNICVEYCPQNVFEKGGDGIPLVKHIEKCTECRLCIVMCPEFAIIANPEVEKSLKER